MIRRPSADQCRADTRGLILAYVTGAAILAVTLAAHITGGW